MPPARQRQNPDASFIGGLFCLEKGEAGRFPRQPHHFDGHRLPSLYRNQILPQKSLWSNILAGCGGGDEPPLPSKMLRALARSDSLSLFSVCRFVIHKVALFFCSFLFFCSGINTVSTSNCYRACGGGNQRSGGGIQPLRGRKSAVRGRNPANYPQGLRGRNSAKIGGRFSCCGGGNQPTFAPEKGRSVCSLLPRTISAVLIHD
jgi:hypothetical protein